MQPTVSERIVDAALSLPSLQQHPEIAQEFRVSLERRTALWSPLLSLVVDELGAELTPATIQLAGSWFALVHLSGPVDQWVDGDAMSSPWVRLGPAGGVNLVMRLIDEALQRPLECAAANDPATIRAITRATLCLSRACVSVTIGNNLDAAGATSLHGDGERSVEAANKAAAIYEQVVGWKTAEIYGCFMQALAMACGASPSQESALHDWGHDFGFCVQVMDDAGGVWGPGDDLEKSPIKTVFPVCFGIGHPHPGREQFWEQCMRPSSERDLDQMRAYLDDIQALAYLEALVECRGETARAALEPLSERSRESLMDWYIAYFRREPAKIMTAACA